MDNGNVKEVYFDKWCKTCVHYDKAEDQDPCWDCLEQGWNLDSHRPIMWEGDLDETIKSQKA